MKSVVVAFIATLALLGGATTAAAAAPSAVSASKMPAATQTSAQSMVQARHTKRHCVTKREFRKVKRGWTMKRVHRKFDTRGHRTYYSSAWPGIAFAEQWRDYRACKRPRWSNIEVDYKYKRKAHRPHSKKRWRVSSKSAYWF